MIPVRTSPVPAVARRGVPDADQRSAPGAATIVSFPFRRTTHVEALERPVDGLETMRVHPRRLDLEQTGELAGVRRQDGRALPLHRLETERARRHRRPLAGRVSSSSRRTSCLASSPRPSPGLSASALARLAASKASSSGRLTASSSRISTIGSDSRGAQTVTYPASARNAASAERQTAPVSPGRRRPRARSPSGTCCRRGGARGTAVDDLHS